MFFLWQVWTCCGQAPLWWPYLVRPWLAGWPPHSSAHWSWMSWWPRAGRTMRTLLWSWAMIRNTEEPLGPRSGMAGSAVLSQHVRIYAKDLEDLVYKMWQKFRKGDKPNHITQWSCVPFLFSQWNTQRHENIIQSFMFSTICKLSLTWLFPLIYSCWQEISWSGQPCDTTPVHPAPPVIPVVSTDIIACPNYAFTLEHTDHNLFSNRMKIYNLYKLRFILLA